MAFGYLTVQVKNKNNSIPLSDTTVTVYNNEQSIISTLTDKGGSTKKQVLQTVDRALSMDPYYTGTPYTVYYVKVEKNGFNGLIIYNVRIFEGEHAILPVTLIPLLNSQDNPFTYEIKLPPAIEQITSQQPSGPAIESSVLRQVVIPNPITIHLGSPDSDAANLEISFIDYVKNVASSEVYPTWPEEALKANIYIITTITLNRILTEWYRGRGYRFDITSSKDYDQYYVYGQTIYESISRLVDLQFSEYLSRIDSIPPHFTVFCHGTTATCDGLSKWGTVSLAKKGYTAIEIIRHYYGDNMEVNQAILGTDIITSYPGSTLKVGCTGLDVQTMQTYLNTIRKNFPSIPLITDQEGNFGTNTKSAVKHFQSIFNLKANGIIGKETWNQINRIFVVVTRLSELYTEGNSLIVGTIPPSSTLKLASNNNDVLMLQYMLNYISLYFPTITTPSQSGIFDSQTSDSVIAFQKMMLLTVDGIVEFNTWQALYDVYWGIRNNTNPWERTADYIDYIVKPGDSLWLLCRRYHMTIDTIKRLNGLTSNSLSIGQLLKIPTKSY